MENKTKKELSYIQKYWIYEICGYLASVGVPVGTCMALFPPEIMEQTGVSVGLSVIITAIIAVAVFKNRISESVKNTSGTVIYIVCACVALLARYVADQLLVVSIVGIIANASSVPLFNIATKNKELNAKLKEKQAETEIQKKLGA